MCVLTFNYEKDQAKLLQRMTVNSKVAKVLEPIPASSDTVESEERQMKGVFDKVTEKSKKSTFNSGPSRSQIKLQHNVFFSSK